MSTPSTPDRRGVLAAALAAGLAALPAAGAEHEAARLAAEEALATCMALPAGAADLVATLEAAGWTRGGEAATVAFAAEVALAFLFDPEAPESSSRQALFVAAMLNDPTTPGQREVLEKEGVALGVFGLDQPRSYCAISGPAALGTAAHATVELTAMVERSVPGLIDRAAAARLTLAALDHAAVAERMAEHLPEAIRNSDAFSIDAAYVQIIGPGEQG